MRTTEERVKNILKKRDDYIMKKRREGYTLVSCIAVVAALIVGTSVISPNVDLGKYEKQLAFETMEEKDLITFSSKEELIKKMKESDAYKNSASRNYGMKYMTDDMAVVEESAMPQTAVNDVNSVAGTKTSRKGILRN